MAQDTLKISAQATGLPDGHTKLERHGFVFGIDAPTEVETDVETAYDMVDDAYLIVAPGVSLPPRPKKKKIEAVIVEAKDGAEITAETKDAPPAGNAPPADGAK